MARLLHRLGRAAATRPLVVLLAWLLVAAGAAGAMTTFQEPLTDEFELPDSEFAQVLEDLGEQVPEVAGGTGTVVLHSDERFTPSQQEAVSAALADWARLPHVADAADPFVLQARLDGRAAELRAGARRLERGWEQHDEGRLQLRRLRWLVAQGQRDIARIEAAAPADPTLPARRDGQAQLEQRLAEGRERLAEAEQRLERGRAELETGRDLSLLGDGVRLVSRDGRTALVQLRFDSSAQEVPPEALERIPEVGEQLARVGVEADYGQEIV
jgi:RND superfamily putative drug exporter